MTLLSAVTSVCHPVLSSELFVFFPRRCLGGVGAGVGTHVVGMTVLFIRYLNRAPRFWTGLELKAGR
jgi:hypothetical protein